MKDRHLSMGRAAAYVAGAALVIMALALVVMQHPSVDEMMQKTGDASEAHKARVKKDTATAKAVLKVPPPPLHSRRCIPPRPKSHSHTPSQTQLADLDVFGVPLSDPEEDDAVTAYHVGNVVVGRQGGQGPHAGSA